MCVVVPAIVVVYKSHICIHNIFVVDLRLYAKH
jgi:hypothetical protein